MQREESGGTDKKMAELSLTIFFLLLFSHDSGFYIEQGGQSAARDTILCGPRALTEV